MIVTCTNEICGNNGIDIDIEPPIDEDTGKIPDHWNGVVCGGETPGGWCGQLLHTHPQGPLQG